jgi:hypothetical protein
MSRTLLAINKKDHELILGMNELNKRCSAGSVMKVTFRL